MSRAPENVASDPIEMVGTFVNSLDELDGKFGGYALTDALLSAAQGLDVLRATDARLLSMGIVPETREERITRCYIVAAHLIRHARLLVQEADDAR